MCVCVCSCVVCECLSVDGALLLYSTVSSPDCVRMNCFLSAHCTDQCTGWVRYAILLHHTAASSHRWDYHRFTAIPRSSRYNFIICLSPPLLSSPLISSFHSFLIFQTCTFPFPFSFYFLLKCAGQDQGKCSCIGLQRER